MIEGLVVAPWSRMATADLDPLPSVFCWAVEVQITEESGAKTAEHDDAITGNERKRMAFAGNRIKRAFGADLLVPR